MAKSRDIADSASVINYIDGLTSDAQTQLDAKAVYPSQTGNNGLFLTTDGSTASWAAAGGGAWTLIETLSPSAASTIDIESFSSAYDIYKIICTLQNSTAAVIRVRLKIGGSYKTSGYKYSNIILNPGNGNTFVNNAATNADYIQPSQNSTTLYKGAEFTIYNANQSQRQIVNFNICNEVALAPETLFGSGGYMAATGTLEGFRIFPNAGGFTGKVHVYGLTGV